MSLFGACKYQTPDGKTGLQFSLGNFPSGKAVISVDCYSAEHPEHGKVTVVVTSVEDKRDFSLYYLIEIFGNPGEVVKDVLRDLITIESRLYLFHIRFRPIGEYTPTKNVLESIGLRNVKRLTALRNPDGTYSLRPSPE